VLAAERFPLLPETQVRTERLRVDLRTRPGLQINGSGGFDPFALMDLPGVGVEVGDERLGVEQLELGPGQKTLRPRLLFQETDRGLVAVKADAKLHFPYERPGPFRFVSRLGGRFPPRR